MKQDKKNNPPRIEQIKVLPSEVLSELRASGLYDDVIADNFKYCEGMTAIDLFLSECQLKHSDRLNNGRVNTDVLKKVNHLDKGYWYTNTYNPLTNEVNFAQCKPVSPRGYYDKEKGKHKIIKYENPIGRDLPIFFLDIPNRIIKKIAKKYNIKDLPNEAIGDKWQWIKNNPQIPIAITEGIKKAGALISIGVIAVASASITTHSEKATEDTSSWFTPLKPQLKWLLERGKREVFLTFDRADTKLTSKLAVNKQTKTIGKKIQNLGHKVKILDWDDPKSKGIDDYLANHGRAKTLKLFSDSIEYHRFIAKLRALGSRKLSNAIKVNQVFFDPNLIQMAVNGKSKIIGIKSQQKTGKSTAIASFLLSDKINSKSVLNITHRQSLSKVLGDKLRINNYQDDIFKEVRNFTNYLDEFSLSICIDSILSIPEDTIYGFIILDEVEQLIWHLLNSKTEISKKRGEAIKRFYKLCENCINNGGSIILADADLSDYSIKFLSSKLNLKSSDVVCFENEFKPFSVRNIIICDNELEIRKEIEKAIELGERLIISLSGQKVNSATGTINYEQWLIARGVDPKNIARIDQETIADPTRKEFDITNNLTKLNLYKVIIHSNSISTGISLDENVIGTIDKSFGVFWGNYPLEDFEQSLERYRGDCDRFVFMPKSKSALFGNGSANENNLTSHYSAKLKQAAAVFDLDQFQFDHDMVFYYSLYGARINGDLRNLRSNFIVHAENKGYNIMTYKEELTKNESDRLRLEKVQIKKQSCDRYAEELKHTPIPSKEDHQKLKQKKRKTKQERLAEHQGDLLERYGDLSNLFLNYPELWGDFVLADLGNLYPQLRRRFNISLGSDQHLFMDRDKAIKKAEYLKKSEGDSYFFDLAYLAKNSVEAKIFELLGIKIAELENKASAVSDQDVENLKALKTKYGKQSLEYRRAAAVLRPHCLTNIDIEEISKKIEEVYQTHGKAIEVGLDLKLSLDANTKERAVARLKGFLTRIGYDLKPIYSTRIDGRIVKYFRVVDRTSVALWEAVKNNWVSAWETQVANIDWEKIA